jgi:hypothetical protein
MNFLKRNFILLICGVAVIGSLVSLVFAISRVKVVSEKMARSLGDGRAILSLVKGEKPDGADSPLVVNRSAVETRRKYNEAVQGDIERTAQKVSDFNSGPRPLMHRGVFPSPITKDAPFEFREVYRDQFDPLLLALQAGDKPSPKLVELVRRYMRDDLMPEMGLIRGHDYDYGPIRGKKTVGYKLDNQAGEMAAREVAIQSRIYAAYESFEIHPLIAGEDMPSPGEMWEAQLNLWIQSDVVNAISSTNAQAAATLDEEGKDLTIMEAPVKHLLGVKIHGYVAEGLSTGSSASSRLRVPTPTRGRASLVRQSGAKQDAGRLKLARKISFTNRQCNDDYDVIAFDFSVICDARDIFLLLREMAKVNLMTQTGMTVKVVPPPKDFTSYVYGEDPIVEVKLEYEAYFLRDIFTKQYMPDELKEQLGVSS